jgi:hypothetical protein
MVHRPRSFGGVDRGGRRSAKTLSRPPRATRGSWNRSNRAWNATAQECQREPRAPVIKIGINARARCGNFEDLHETAPIASVFDQSRIMREGQRIHKTLLAHAAYCETYSRDSSGVRSTSGAAVSSRPCQYLRRKLPDASTCGRLCDGFPRCLPTPSAELLERVSELGPTAARSLQHMEQLRHREQVSEALDELHAAILRGLARKPTVAAEEMPDA